MTELLRRADVAMYVAKQSRRGTATEKTSLIDPLTTVVLGKALAAVRQWRDAGRYFGLCLLERPLTIATAVSMVKR